ncbi:MAG: hypothetical protein M1835_000279 [Candelina submexicana]|nr:MAG: hypothetical protein M1835_000279 [Candelina submexicana]
MSNSPPLSRYSAPCLDERFRSLQASSEQRRAVFAQTNRHDNQSPQQQRRISDLLEEGAKRPNTLSQSGESTEESRTLVSSPESQATSLSGQSAFVSTNANRGSKAHVPAACVNCQKAHLRCSIQRPCPRCTSMGKADSCVDVQHKKRGRPRLRDGRGLRSDAVEAVPSRTESYERTPSISQPGSSPIEHLRGSGLPIAIMSLDGNPIETMAETEPRPTTKSQDCPRYVAPRNQPLEASHSTSPSAAIALLNLDLMIIRSGQSLSLAFGREIGLDGKNLLDIVLESARERVLKLRCQLRDESHYQDPDYSRLSGDDEMNFIQSIDEADVEKATRGFHDRFERLPMRFADGQCRDVMVVLRLARATVFFVTMVVPHSAPDSWTGPMLPSIMQVEHPQQTSQASATLPSLGHLPFHRTISSGPANPPSTYYSRLGHQASLATGEPRPLKADTCSSQSQHHRSASTASVSSTLAGPSLNSSLSEGPNRPGTGYDRLGYDELHSLQLPPLLSASSAADSNGGSSSSRGVGPTNDHLHDSSGRRSTKRERVGIEEMID